MTQQIRTISRANGLRRLTTIIAYHNRGNRSLEDRASVRSWSSKKIPSTILPMVPRKTSRHVDHDFQSLLDSRLRYIYIYVRVRTFLLINLLLRKYVSLVTQQNISRRRVLAVARKSYSCAQVAFTPSTYLFNYTEPFKKK